MRHRRHRWLRRPLPGRMPRTGWQRRRQRVFRTQQRGRSGERHGEHRTQGAGLERRSWQGRPSKRPRGIAGRRRTGAGVQRMPLMTQIVRVYTLLNKLHVYKQPSKGLRTRGCAASTGLRRSGQRKRQGRLDSPLRLRRPRAWQQRRPHPRLRMHTRPSWRGARRQRQRWCQLSTFGVVVNRVPPTRKQGGLCKQLARKRGVS